MTGKTSLQLSARKSAARPSLELERFHFLIAQIEKARKARSETEAGISSFLQSRTQKLQPLRDSLAAVSRETAFTIDRLLDQPGWARNDRSALREILRGTVEVLLEMNGDDAELKALYDKHSGVDFNSAKQDELQRLKAQAEEMTGLDLGADDGILTEEDLVQRMYEEMAAQRSGGRRAATRPI